MCSCTLQPFSFSKSPKVNNTIVCLQTAEVKISILLSTAFLSDSVKSIRGITNRTTWGPSVPHSDNALRSSIFSSLGTKSSDVPQPCASTTVKWRPAVTAPAAALAPPPLVSKTRPRPNRVLPVELFPVLLGPSSKALSARDAVGKKRARKLWIQRPEFSVLVIDLSIAKVKKGRVQWVAGVTHTRPLVIIFYTSYESYPFHCLGEIWNNTQAFLHLSSLQCFAHWRFVTNRCLLLSLTAKQYLKN